MSIPLHKVLIAPDADEKIKPTLFSGMLTEGPRVKEFEEKLFEFLGCGVLTTNSCTSAIDLALQLLGIGPGDEVISTPLTCSATNTHVLLRGARLVWADVNPETGNIDARSVGLRVTDRTKAIIVVDWGGRPVDCSVIRANVVGHIPIIQDAAHSFGAYIGDSPASGYGGDFIAWSFQAIKHLTTGDGGALRTPFHSRNRARALRWFGIDREIPAKFRFLQDIPEPGFKYHMNDLTAALGLANLPHAIESLKKYRANAERLCEALKDCRVVQRAPWDAGSSWWFYSLRTPRPLEFVEFAEARGIGAGPVHGRNDIYSSYPKSHHPLPGVDAYYSPHVAIPCGWWLSQSDLEQIAETVHAWDKTL
jgi:dTDP-4-amino-4,6-dideoxygalactose transaminase